MTHSPVPHRLGGFQPESFKSLLDRARGEELGLFIAGTGSAHAFEVAISRVKAIYPGHYDDLMICIPSIPETIFIVKKSVELSD